MKVLQAMNDSQFDIIYDRTSHQFKLSSNGLPAIDFDDFELNFRLSRVSLKSKRILPVQTASKLGRKDFFFSLKAIGSDSVLRMAQLNGSFCAKTVGKSVLLSYSNDFGEVNYSPEKAVCLIASALPQVSKMVLFHNRSNEFQNFDCEGLWWSQAAFIEPQTTDYYDWGMLLLVKFKDGRIGTLLPVTNDTVLGRIQWNGSHGLSIISCSGNSGSCVKEYPLVLFTIAQNVQQAIEQVLDSAHSLNPKFNLSAPTALPQPFDKLGWCSWNAFGPEVNEDKVLDTVEQAKTAGLNLGYVLIDDGWLDTQKQGHGKFLSEGITSTSLKSIDPCSEKFPHGMKNTVEKIKEHGISHVGLWHTLNGYWHGFSSENPLVAHHPEWFIKTSIETIVPSENSRFYKVFYNNMKSWGVDFVKVDNQGYHRRALPYQASLPSYMASIQRQFQDALTTNSFHAIYCMATHPEVIFNAASCQLLRISNDFVPNDAFGARRHIINNFYNDSWLSHIFWTDYDMFQSNDIYAETFARMLAISASPIYISDKPGEINFALLKKLILPSGIVPRYSQSAQVLDATFFDDPFSLGNILAVKALYGDTVTLGLFNTVETGTAVTGSFNFAEIGLAPGDYLVYSDTSLDAQVKSTSDSILYSLKALKSSLIHIAPIKNGFAVIGNTDYFASPALIEKTDITSASANISLKAPGCLVCYSQKQPLAISASSQTLQRVDTHPASGQFSYINSVLTINSAAPSVLIEF